ncbi:MAG: FAD-dependent oxidoreductase [Deltaproteobacteria bacterium]|nr:FAD-dependent oxidoreductase [Deltaproteobacteria bacterium]
MIGGGACGMTAAWELAQNGAEVVVVEKESRIGGLCATHEFRGWRFDLGGHRFISRNGELVRRVVGLVGDDMLTSERRSVILHGGGQYRYPLAAEDLARKMNVKQGALAVGSYLQARLATLLRPSPDVSFEDWVVSRFGRYLYELFFGPYTEKLWGVHPSQLSADWASERISLLHLGDAILRVARLKNRNRPRTHARRYFYPRRGIGQVFEMMADEIRHLGGQVLLDSDACGLERDAKGRVRGVRCRNAEGQEELISCDQVISTAPLSLLTRWLFPNDGEIERHAAALRYRSVRFLNILLNRSDVSESTWMYVSEPRYLPTRIQEPKRRSPEMAPPGKTSLMLEIPCNEGDGTWRASDESLYQKSIEDLQGLGFERIREDTLGYFSTRVAEGYPVYDLGYKEHQLSLLSSVAQAPNVLSCGRQGMFRYVFMDIAMEMGIAAARQVLGNSAWSQAELVGFRTDKQLIEAQSMTA